MHFQSRPDKFRRRLLIASAFLLAAVLSAAAGCGSSESPNPPAASISAGEKGKESKEEKAGPAAPVPRAALPDNAEEAFRDRPDVTLTKAARRPIVVMTTSLGAIKIELNQESAPVTVGNFLDNYVDRGAYDGTIFHYVGRDFAIVGGGFDESRSPRAVREEIFCEANNELKNVRGAISMARHPDFPHSATGQFFINVVDNPELDHTSTETSAGYGYCVFGRVIEGMDVVDRIAAGEVQNLEGFPNIPVKPVVVQSARRIP